MLAWFQSGCLGTIVRGREAGAGREACGGVVSRGKPHGFRYTLRDACLGKGVLWVLVGLFLNWLFPSGLAAAEPPGVVVAYSPAESRQYLGSPSLVALSDTEYVLSHDVFGPGSSRDRTHVYGSTDRGATWTKRAEIVGQWWSTLCLHRNNLYLFGTNKEYGDCVIRRSSDGGRTWTTPDSPGTGLLHRGKYHTAPVPLVYHAGRIWRAMEDAEGNGGWGHHFRAFVMSAPIESDLLNAANWTSTNRIARDANWLEGKFYGWLEGNLVVLPDGTLGNLLRVDTKTFPEWGALLRVSADGKAVTFDPQADFFPLSGGAKKFTIRRDEATGVSLMLANAVPEAERTGYPGKHRNHLALLTSTDLKTWTVKQTLLSHPDVEKHGFQYVDWQFAGDDLIAAVRTAFDDDAGGARNQHDSNFILFLRIKNYRAAAGLPVAQGNLEIRAPAGDSEIVVKTTARVAGAVDSLTWNGREFLDSFDHGRQLQSATNFDAGVQPIRAETYNPTEAGSKSDWCGPQSTSVLLAAMASGTRLSTRSQMAFWLRPGETSGDQPARNGTALSSHQLEKTISLGGRPHVLEYDVRFTLTTGKPFASEGHTHGVFEALTGYMPAEFSVFETLPAGETELRAIDDGPGEQPHPLVFSTPSGSHAMGIVALNTSPDLTGPTYGRFRFPGEKVVKWNAVYRTRTASALEQTAFPFRLRVIVGDRAIVRETLHAVRDGGAG
jgi:hypothetical protein